MSWRTQSDYQGLDDVEAEWLKAFDRHWDTKAQGRSRSDALERLVRWSAAHIRECASLEPTIQDSAVLEAALLKLASRISRIAVPRALKQGWSIHVVMKCGKRARIHFEDESSAAQAYYAITELSHWFLPS